MSSLGNGNVNNDFSSKASLMFTDVFKQVIDSCLNQKKDKLLSDIKTHFNIVISILENRIESLETENICLRKSFELSNGDARSQVGRFTTLFHPG